MGSSTSDYLQLSLLDHSNSVGSESENEKKKGERKKCVVKMHAAKSHRQCNAKSWAGAWLCSN